MAQPGEALLTFGTPAEVAELKEIISSLHEFNPMMGHRGCRLDVTYPEIGAMQTRAIIEAACECQKKGADSRFRKAERGKFVHA